MMIMIEKHPPRPNALTEHPNGFHPERGKLFLPMWNPPAQTQLSQSVPYDFHVGQDHLPGV